MNNLFNWAKKSLAMRNLSKSAPELENLEDLKQKQADYLREARKAAMQQMNRPAVISPGVYATGAAGGSGLLGQLYPGGSLTANNTSNGTYVNLQQQFQQGTAVNPLTSLHSPYGCNGQVTGRLVIIAVPKFDPNMATAGYMMEDVVLSLDSMEYRQLQLDPVSTMPTLIWNKVKLNPDGTVSNIVAEVEVKEDRKEVFEEFEKHLNLIPESKQNHSILQKAKDLFSPPGKLTPALGH